LANVIRRGAALEPFTTSAFVRPFAVADARAGMGLRARRRTLCSAKRTIPEMKEATP